MMCRVKRIDFVVRPVIDLRVHRQRNSLSRLGPLCHLPSFAHCCSVCWFVDPDLGGTRKTVAQGFMS
jgi:hypothetical protein